MVMMALLAACVGIWVPSSVNAQDRTPTTTRERVDDDNDVNYGWIGLLGLIGLAGLAKKPVDTRYVNQPATKSY